MTSYTWLSCSSLPPCVSIAYAVLVVVGRVPAIFDRSTIFLHDDRCMVKKNDPNLQLGMKCTQIDLLQVYN